MAIQLESESPPGVSNLVGGIIQDLRQLLVQQMTLFQVEVKNDVRRTIEACIPISVGAFVLLVAAVTLAVALSHLLCWLWPALPLWGGFGIVGACATLVGVALILIGKLKFDTFNPLPEKSLEGLKENMQWKTKM